MRLAAWLVAVAILTLVGAAPADAAWVSERVVDRGGHGFDDVSLASNERGDAALVFQRDRGISVALAKPGRNFGRARYIRSGRGGHDPRVAVDERGNVLVLWTYNDHSRGPDPGDLRDEGCCEHVRLALLRAGGKRFSAPKSVGPRGEDVYLEAFSMINGRIGVAWSDINGVAARFSRRGLRLGPVMRAPGGYEAVAAAPLRTGAVLTFTRLRYRPDDRTDWSVAELRARTGRSPARRTLLSRTRRVPWFALAGNAKGAQVLAWSEPNASERYDIYAGFRTRTGRFHPRRMLQHGSFDSPRVAIARSGAAIVAWELGGRQIFVASRKPGGALDRGRAFGSRASRGTTNLQVAVDATARAVIGWQGGGQHAAFRTRAGRRLGVHEFGRTTDAARHGALALDKRGVARLAWRYVDIVSAARGRFPRR